jgi:hypothetical protein
MAIDHRYEVKLTREEYEIISQEARRYRYVRRLNAKEFRDLFVKCMRAAVRFDEEVDRLIVEAKSPDKMPD